jgi:hypothetical protein
MSDISKSQIIQSILHKEDWLARNHGVEVIDIPRKEGLIPRQISTLTRWDGVLDDIILSISDATTLFTTSTKSVVRLDEWAIFVPFDYLMFENYRIGRTTPV